VLGGGTPVVYVVDVAAAPGTGAVRAVPVAPGAAVAGAVEVRGDLEPGQLVVVRGNERLRAGVAVSFTP
jgi:multidrug efflux pump subunit AcrA (membrane-fusion protein)